jgi:ABC-type transporter Mla MlaB component
VIPSANTRPALRIDRPTCQWELSRQGGPVRLRLYGVLGPRDLDRVADTLRERCRAPRDLACVDFDEVQHLDYRALQDFVARLMRQRERGAAVWITGLSPYLRALFQVAGQGPALARLEWGAIEETAPGGQARETSRIEAWDGMVA